MDTRRSFHDALDELWVQMASIAELDCIAIERATLSLMDANRQLAELVINEYPDIEAVGTALEDQALQLLALQSPVASDLRLVLSTFPTTAALVRMGGLARHIAKLTRAQAPEAVVDDPQLRDIVGRIGETALEMARGVAAALRNQDADAARAVDRADEQVDGLYRQLLTRAANPAGARAATGPAASRSVDSAVNAALLGRFYERFADQAVDASRRIAFIVTGVRETGR